MSEGIIALILVILGIVVHYRALYVHYIIQNDDLLDTSWEKYFTKVSQPMQFFHMVLGPLVALLIIIGLFLYSYNEKGKTAEIKMENNETLNNVQSIITFHIDAERRYSDIFRDRIMKEFKNELKNGTKILTVASNDDVGENNNYAIILAYPCNEAKTKSDYLIKQTINKTQNFETLISSYNSTYHCEKLPEGDISFPYKHK